jgi:hypothetical protein
MVADAGYFVRTHKGMCAPMSAEMLDALGSVKP